MVYVEAKLKCSCPHPAPGSGMGASMSPRATEYQRSFVRAKRSLTTLEYRQRRLNEFLWRCLARLSATPREASSRFRASGVVERWRRESQNPTAGPWRRLLR